jgi:GMP synthase PP-ATPase subunit
LIDLESEKANVIRAADVIIIDEVSGMHKVNKINFKFNDLLLLGSVGLFG